MALAQATIKATILAELALVSAISDPTKAAAFAEAMSQAIFKVLTAQSTVVVPGGSSAGSYPIT